MKIFGPHLAIEERKFFHSLVFPLFFAFVLFTIKLVEELEGLSFVKYGAVPHSSDGFLRIFTFPFIHKDWGHLFGNASSLVILGCVLFYFYSKVAYQAFFTIWILSGLGIWLGGRESYHIGASGLVYGLILFLLVGSVYQRSKPMAAVAFLVILFYGSFIWGMIPVMPNLPYSWEVHLWGAIAGVITAIIYGKAEVTGVSQEPVYSFEQDEEENLDEDRYWEIPPNDDESK